MNPKSLCVRRKTSASFVLVGLFLLGGLLLNAFSLSTCVLVQHAGHHTTHGPGPHGQDISHSSPTSFWDALPGCPETHCPLLEAFLLDGKVGMTVLTNEN